MRRTTKRLLSTLMAVAMAFSLLAAVPLTASAAIVAQVGAHPSNVTVDYGATATFIATIIGDPAPTSPGRWEQSYNGGPWHTMTPASAGYAYSTTSAYTSSTMLTSYLTIENAFTELSVYTYRFRAENLYGSATTNAATLTVRPPVCRIGQNDLYGTLDEALAEVKTGQTITLLQDIAYTKSININIKDVTFNLNGKTLTINYNSDSAFTYGIHATNGGAFKLADPTNGTFDITSSGAFTAEARTGSSLTVGNITCTRANGYCASAIDAGSELFVTGNVTTTGASSIGVYAGSGGKVTIDGTITVPAGATYIRLGSTIKTQSQHSATSSKPGYLEYTDGTNYVWVKDTRATEPLAVTGPADEDVTVKVGDTVTFSVTASGGVPPYIYQWQWWNSAGHWQSQPQSDNVTGTKESTMTITSSGTSAGRSFTYRCAVTDSAGNSVESTSVKVTVTAEEKTVSIDEQSAELKPGVAGTVSFPVVTALIDDGKAGVVSWFSDKGGTTPGAAPAGITAAVSNVASNAATVTITATAATVEGIYYFRVTIDDVDSEVATLTIGEEASTATPTGMAHFTKSRTYSPSLFTDIDEDDWYGVNKQGSIATAYEYGLVNGMGGTTFAPGSDFSVMQAIALAARVHSIYTTGNDIVQGEPWHVAFLDYAIASGIVSAGQFTNLDRACTRAEMAYIFSRSLPAGEFAAQNTVNSLPDVDASTQYSDEIFMLYKAGVIAGNDAVGTFAPDDNMTRATAAGIINNIIIPANRGSGKTFG